MDWLADWTLGNAAMATLLAVLAFGVGRLSRQPALAHVLWVLVLVKLVTPPLVPLPMGVLDGSGDTPPGSLAALEVRSLPLDVPGVGAVEGAPGVGRPVEAARAPAPPEVPSSGSFPIPWIPILLGLWLGGAGTCFTVAAVRTRRFRVLMGRSVRAPPSVEESVRRLSARLGVRRPPQVHLLDAVVSPMLWVVGRRRLIILPERLWSRLRNEETMSLLAHELAHLRRRDHYVRWLELAATGLYWWLPVVWWARRELRRAEEDACDAWVVWALPESRPYGDALLETVDFLAGVQPVLSVGGSCMGQRSTGTLKRRLRKIMEANTPRRLNGVARLAVAGLAAASLSLVPVPAHQTEGEGDGDAPGDRVTASGEGRRPRGVAEAIDAALDWLRRHQSSDGRWKSRDFTSECRTPCRNLDPDRHRDGRGFDGHDVGATGLALLAFSGAGYTHRLGERRDYVECVRRGVRFLLSVQHHSDAGETNGLLGDASNEQWVYDHALATRALSELFLLTDDAELRRPVADAVGLCLRAQNEGMGWRYGIEPGENDTSVTGCMVSALKTAQNAPHRIPKERFDEAFAGASRWLDRVTAQNGRTGYRVPGDEGARVVRRPPEPYPFSKELPAMTAMAIFSRLLLGEHRSSAAVRKGVDLLMEHLPHWREQEGDTLSTVNFYYWYCGTHAIFLYGGPRWTRWGQAVSDTLLQSQRTESEEENGSWDPIGEWGFVGGRVYSTALAAMTLEVHFRFSRVAGEK